MTQDQKQLIVVLGDQLTANIAALRAGSSGRDVVLLAEVREETRYVRHHKKKIAFLFSAMRHFRDELRQAGWRVDYVELGDEDNSGSITGEIERAVARHDCGRIVATEPGEWRLLTEFERLRDRFGVPFEILTDDRFLCTRSAFAEWAKGRKQSRMETFYRDMRRKTGLLLEPDDTPCGGRWNFDSENRKAPKQGLMPAGPKRFTPDRTTRQVLQLVGKEFEDHFGALEPFWFAVTAADAQAAYNHFLETSLASFGDYQDAMVQDQPFLYHAMISLYLNAGLLDPLEVCKSVEHAYREGRVSLNSAEGFIRQIIGWREYVRGIYWLEMPDYVDRNALEHERPLPAFYWTGETDMACLSACIVQTRDEAYAHHIQRLMITGNFAMLIGADPKAVHEWYLAVYADAYEWVELPNTLGMSQFADGGLLGSKPYAASGNYINRMSDYCGTCRYAVKEKTGPDACPFNYLYWDFMARHRTKLQSTARLSHTYRTLDRMSEERKAAITADAARFVRGLAV